LSPCSAARIREPKLLPVNDHKISIGLYFVGAVLMFNVLRHELNAIPAAA
jgi:hypothetical protein